MESVMPKPLTREEQYLYRIATGEGKIPSRPITREEMYLNKIIDADGCVPTTPIMRRDDYLDAIASKVHLTDSILKKTITSISSSDIHTVRSGAFYRCYDLLSVDLPSVTTIGSLAFSQCYSLKSINIPRVKEISYTAFNECTSLTSIDLHSVETIGKMAFTNCNSLTTVIIRTTEQVCTIDSSFKTFPNSDKLRIYVPRALVDSYKSSNGWKSIQDLIVALEDYTVDGTIAGRLK